VVSHLFNNGQVAQEYHTSPPIPVNSFLLKFQEKHEGLKSLSCDPFYVLDGMQNPLKQSEDNA
jgi:hypothetical protein